VDIIISRFRVSANPDVADPATETILLREKQGFDAHKGGGMEFDPRDNMLYVGLGDDRQLLIAQDDKSPLGKIIRLEVDRVMPDFIGDASGMDLDENWAYGLRNPWRFDIDLPSNHIFVGDVGDHLWEEINLVPLGIRGFNFGWPCMEGGYVFPETNEVPECQSPWLFKRAIHEYPHVKNGPRCAVIGGKVNRPSYNPDDGRFIFADMCSREVFSLAHTGGVWQPTLLGILDGDLISTIGEGVDGTQYIGTVAQPGPIYRMYIP
jgi:glucose/arabinose dehydrogenase